MYLIYQQRNNRNDLEASIFAAAFRQSYERSDGEGLRLAHKQLSLILITKRKESDADREAYPDKNEPEAEISTSTADTPQTVDTKPIEPGKEAQRVDIQPSQPEIEQKLVRQDAGGDYYQLLDVNYMAEFAEIHIAFLRKIHKLLANPSNNDDLKAFRTNLSALCIAHDILKDPVTRTDYDFRQMGVRSNKPAAAGDSSEEKVSVGIASKSRLKIGELLQCAGILDTKELEIAVDMHKAIPESPFGQFLVKQGFLSQEILKSALIGQHLILAGKITVGQYQVAMYSVKDAEIPLSDTLMVRGWADENEIEEASLAAAEPPSVVTLPPAEIEMVQQEQTPIAADSAMPSWADQIDWDGPDDESKLMVETGRDKNEPKADKNSD